MRALRIYAAILAGAAWTTAALAVDPQQFAPRGNDRDQGFAPSGSLPGNSGGRNGSQFRDPRDYVNSGNRLRDRYTSAPNELDPGLFNSPVPDPNRFNPADDGGFRQPANGSGNPSLATGPHVAPAYPLPDGNGVNTKQPRWRLGVYSKDSDTGVRIVQVVPGSPAAKAGIEVDDQIIAINGFQVGYVGGELYDTTTEFERSANKEGWVNILVLDHRSARLSNIPVQLDSRLARVSGNVTYRDRNGALPQGSYAVVELKEIIRPGAPQVPLTKQVVQSIRQFPVNFDLEYDPSLIDRQRSYIVTAAVYAPDRRGDRVVFNTRQPLQVLADNRPQPQVLVAVEQVADLSDPNFSDRNDRDDQLAQLYRDYLQRDPGRNTLTRYRSMLDQGSSLNDVRADLLGQPNFFNQCDSDQATYVSKMFELILNRRPSERELQDWLQKYDDCKGFRPEFAKRFLAENQPR